MRTHGSTDWAQLGQAVHEARTERGLGKTREWAAAVGKSERTLLELERGGKVGTTTLEAIEDALEWPRAGAYRVLNGLPWRELVASRTTTAVAAPDLMSVIERIERRLDAIESKLEGRSGDVASAAQKSDNVRQFPTTGDAQETSEPDETMKPAADDVNEDDDEEPGGSDDHE